MVAADAAGWMLFRLAVEQQRCQQDALPFLGPEAAERQVQRTQAGQLDRQSAVVPGVFIERGSPPADGVGQLPDQGSQLLVVVDLAIATRTMRRSETGRPLRHWRNVRVTSRRCDPFRRSCRQAALSSAASGRCMALA